MDLDWCFCGKRAGPGDCSPYCCKDCYENDLQPQYDSLSVPSDEETSLESSISDAVYDPFRRAPSPTEYPIRTQWVGTGREGILAWAQNIPPHMHRKPSSSSRSVASSSTGGDLTTPTKKLRPSKLAMTRQRPLPPQLCRSTTQPARTNIQSASPISTPSGSGHRTSRTSQRVETTVPTESYSSLVSVLTDSVATPASFCRRPSFILSSSSTSSPVPIPPKRLDHAKSSGVFSGLLRAWGNNNNTVKIVTPSTEDVCYPFANDEGQKSRQGATTTARGVEHIMKGMVGLHEERPSRTLAMKHQHHQELQQKVADMTRGRKMARAIPMRRGT